MIRDSLNEKTGVFALLPAMLLFTVIGMIVTLLTALLLAVMISKGIVPESARNITALCCVPGTFLAGFFTAKRAGRRILPMGLLAGGCFLLLLLLISVIFLPELETWNGFPGILAACAGGSAAGALCAAGMRKR